MRKRGKKWQKCDLIFKKKSSKKANEEKELNMGKKAREGGRVE